MTYLNVSPMIAALRTTPDEFEMRRGWLFHLPSQHWYYFDPDGSVQLDTRCDCALLSIQDGQERELCEAFAQWRTAYWRPLVINREFASHFTRPRGWRRLLRSLTVRLRRRSMRERRRAIVHAHPAVVRAK